MSSRTAERTRFPWRTALKIAWRESRASSVKFAFVVLAVATGVGALAGVRGFSEAFRDMLLSQARTLMAGDLSVRVFELATPEQERVIQDLAAQGVNYTQVTETVSMMAPERGGDPLLVSVKAVDPTKYPFYGDVELSPPGRLRDVLAADAMAAASDVLLRMDLKVGDRVQLGGVPFRIVAEVLTEPDRMTGSLNVGPRVLITREGLEQAGLIRLGSRAAQRYLFRLPPGSTEVRSDGKAAPGKAPVQQARERLKAAFPEGRISDFRETHPAITRGLNRATTFLSLVSLIALIVGALGVATAMHSHLQQKLDSIAVMKCLGARSVQIIRIYLVQALLLGVLGSAFGVAFGLAVQLVFPSLIARYFQLRPPLMVDWSSVAQSVAVGLLTTLLFTLPTLLSIRKVRPALVFRREMAEGRRTMWARLKDSRASVAAGLLIIGGLAGTAAWLGSSRLLGTIFAGGLLVSLLFMSGVAWALLRALKLFVRRSSGRWFGWRIPAPLRHGIANLYRPGNHAGAVLVALGMGVTFTVTVYLVQRSMLDQIMRSAPKDMPNVFVINITPSEQEGIRQMLEQQAGVEGKLEIVPSVSARIVAVNGTPVEQLKLTGWERRFVRSRSVTWSATVPAQTDVIKGAWWDEKPQSAKLVSVAEETARILKISPGDAMDWDATGVKFSAKVACIHRSEAVRVGSNVEFIFNPGALDGLPALYFGALRVKPDRIPPLQKAAFAAYPAVTVINAADVLTIVQEVVDQVAIVVRFISAFAILAGIVILASSVASTRFRRIREVVILKTLGGTKARIARIFSIEFLMLGAVAGLIGGLLATAFSTLLLQRIFETAPRLDLLPGLVCVLGTAILANFAGWLASFRTLGQRPLEALRDE